MRSLWWNFCKGCMGNSSVSSRFLSQLEGTARGWWLGRNLLNNLHKIYTFPFGNQQLERLVNWDIYCGILVGLQRVNGIFTVQSWLIKKHWGGNYWRGLEIRTLLGWTGVLVAAWKGAPLLSPAASRGAVHAGSGISVFWALQSQEDHVCVPQGAVQRLSPSHLLTSKPRHPFFLFFSLFFFRKWKLTLSNKHSFNELFVSSCLSCWGVCQWCLLSADPSHPVPGLGGIWLWHN